MSILGGKFKVAVSSWGQRSMSSVLLTPAKTVPRLWRGVFPGERRPGRWRAPRFASRRRPGARPAGGCWWSTPAPARCWWRDPSLKEKRGIRKLSSVKWMYVSRSPTCKLKRPKWADAKILLYKESKHISLKNKQVFTFIKGQFHKKIL